MKRNAKQKRRKSMYYLLNFKTHTFISCNTATVVIAELKDAKEDGEDMSLYEIVNCHDDSIRTDGQTFLSEFETLED